MSKSYINDLPYEIIKLLIDEMDGQSWINFDRTNKCFHNILSENERYAKYIEINKKKCDKHRGTIIIDGIEYYMTHKKMNKSMQKKRKYENTCYVFCNYCCAELNSRNLQKHQLLHCNGWHDLICKRCGVVDPHHTNCKFAYVQCGYCETSFYKYEIRAHETECGNILLKCDDCHESVKCKDFVNHVNLCCTEIRIRYKHCGKMYQERNCGHVLAHDETCTRICNHLDLN